MTDETQFPEEVRAKLAEIDEARRGIINERAEAQAVMDRLLAEDRRYLDIRGAIWSTAEMCMRALMPPDLARQVETLGQDSLLPPERRRRDIRGEVLAFVTNRSPCGPVSYIAAGLVTSVTSVERALAWHERDGRLIETNGVWRVASADTPPLGAGTEAAAATVPASFPGLLVVDSSMPPEQFEPALKELKRRLGQGDDPPPAGGEAAGARGGRREPVADAAEAGGCPATDPLPAVPASSLPPQYGDEPIRKLKQEQFDRDVADLETRLDPPPPEALPPRTVPSADRVLDFVTRAGEIGVSEEQLSRIGATPSIMNILSHNETAALGDDGRWRALPPGGDEA